MAGRRFQRQGIGGLRRVGELPLSRNRILMNSVHDRYVSHLAPVYLCAAGGCAAALFKGEADLRDLNGEPRTDR